MIFSLNPGGKNYSSLLSDEMGRSIRTSPRLPYVLRLDVPDRTNISVLADLDDKTRPMIAIFSRHECQVEKNATLLAPSLTMTWLCSRATVVCPQPCNPGMAKPIMLYLMNIVVHCAPQSVGKLAYHELNLAPPWDSYAAKTLQCVTERHEGTEATKALKMEAPEIHQWEAHLLNWLVLILGTAKIACKTAGMDGMFVSWLLGLTSAYGNLTITLAISPPYPDQPPPPISLHLGKPWLE